MDRFGRLLMDTSPHVAMMGHNVLPRNNNNISNLSVLTNDGSLYSAHYNQSRLNENHIPEHINRIVNPGLTNSIRYQNAQYTAGTE